MQTKGQTDSCNKHTFKFRSLILPTDCTKSQLKDSVQYASISATNRDTQLDARGLDRGDVTRAMCETQ